MLILSLKALLACLIAASVTWLEEVTTKYPRTIRLFWRRWSLWVYATIYGLIAFGFTLAYGELVGAGVLQPVGLAKMADSKSSPKGEEGPEANGKQGPLQQNQNPPPTETHTPSWWVVIFLGLSSKALLHIRLFSVPSTGNTPPFPVGTETVVMIFEPWLMRTTLLQENEASLAFLAPKSAHYTDLDLVKKKFIDAIPESFPKDERIALEIAVGSKTGVRATLELFLRTLGPKIVDREFPTPPPPASSSHPVPPSASPSPPPENGS